MASISSLKQALRQEPEKIISSPEQPLLDREYKAGFEVMVQGFESTTYQHSIIPYLSHLFGPGLGDSFKTVNSMGLFDAEMYLGGHGCGKTSSFKRCLFLKDIGAKKIAEVLLWAIQTRPLSLFYLRLLQGGGAVPDVETEATAFGRRDWDFSCVITGTWSKEQDESRTAHDSVQWVYKVVETLSPLSSGVYSADLGPDPRDLKLATKSFGSNLSRLAHLNRRFNPYNMLACTCSLPKVLITRKIIFLVTGYHGAGKDYCANIWCQVFSSLKRRLTVRVVSISDSTKREYATATGADLNRLLSDRAYKELHRTALSEHYRYQKRQRPQLPEEHFLSVVHGAIDADVLFVTGVRDKTPVAAFSHLVPASQLLEIRVEASVQTRQSRRGHGDMAMDGEYICKKQDDLKPSDDCPSLVFNNDQSEKGAVEKFARLRLLPFVHEDLRRLSSIVDRVSDFPRQGIEFRHLLGISQQAGGLGLCSTLLQTHFVGDWTEVSVIVCCEAGGFVFASSLASRVDVPLALIRKAGRLHQATTSVVKLSSYISGLGLGEAEKEPIEIEKDVILKDRAVVVVDGVLSTGKSLCAVLDLLVQAGVSSNRVSVMVVAELPVYRGREMLRIRGFGSVRIQSLLVLDGT
ncbi:adenine phosphoribosyltransferase [Diplocarpon mali]|nr:adenine phosphoribosyltransferase [Diplocarpon mali]